MDCRVFLFTMLLLSSRAEAQCRLCAPSTSTELSTPSRALTIEIETALDFSRAAQTSAGSGSIAVDERSGARMVNGLVDLGGMAVKGSVRLAGEPFRHVRVSFPAGVRLTAPDGAGADVVDLKTDLSPDPALDANGMLKFSFGGRLIVSGHLSGDLRGRIAITADYQ
jgi:hypothetical protein